MSFESVLVLDMKRKMDIQIFYECRGAHAHSYPQILVPLQKTMSIRVGNNEYDVIPQKLCFVPPAMSHQCDYQGELLVINLVEGTDDARDSILLSRPMIISTRGQVVQLVNLIQTELKQNPDSKSVHHLYSYLYSKLLESCAAPSIRYISEHYNLPITVNKLAEIENYNVTYYNDWFKQQTGISPNLYLRHTRIDRAKELLAYTQFTVMEIAIMVGYSSNATFTRAFHSITGMTPKAYRECPRFRHIS